MSEDNLQNESINDVMTVGSKQWMSHADRQAFVKSRKYYPTKELMSEAKSKEELEKDAAQVDRFIDYFSTQPETPANRHLLERLTQAKEKLDEKLNDT